MYRRAWIGLDKHRQCFQRPGPFFLPGGDSPADLVPERGVLQKTLRQVGLADCQRVLVLFHQRLLLRRPFLRGRLDRLEHAVAFLPQRPQLVLQKLLAQRLGDQLQAGLQGLHLPVDQLDLSFVLRDLGRRAGLDDAVLRHNPALWAISRVKDRLQAIILLLSYRFKFVVMAAGALDRRAEQAVHGDLQRPFQNSKTIGADFVRVAVALARAVGRVTQEVRGDKRIDHAGINCAAGDVTRQLIACQLLLDKTVQRLVLVERADDVVPIAPGEGAVAVGVEVAVGVRVTGSVKPVLAPALAVARRSEKPFDEPIVSVARLVVHEGRDIFGRGGQARQVKAQPSRQDSLARLGRKHQAFALQGRDNEAIDVRTRSAGIPNSRDGRANNSHKRPVSPFRRRCSRLLRAIGRRRRQRDQRNQEDCEEYTNPWHGGKTPTSRLGK